MIRRAGIWRSLVGLLVLTGSAVGQAAVASLGGSVSDASGGVMPGAALELRNTKTGALRQGQSDEMGRYVFTQVPPGIYRLVARSSGFREAVVEPVELRVNVASTLNVVFEKLSDVVETVTVASAVAEVNTMDATMGKAFGERPIVQLPFNARNVAGLLSLQSGVTFLHDDPADVRFVDLRNGAIHGARSDQSNVTLDGVDVNDHQGRLAFTSVLRNTLDSVQEFRVTTTNANADQGRSSGAQVALVTKSGTNEFHGAAYAFHRNTVTSANDFFNNRGGVERPKLIRNIFGGALGGPIVRNRAFFFGNFEGRTDRSDQNVLREVPLAHMRRGAIRYLNTSGGVSELSPLGLRRIDPLGLGASPALLAVLDQMPAANDETGGDGVNTGGYRFTAPTPLTWKTYIARLDWSLDRAGRHLLFARGNLQNDRVSGVPQFPGQPPATVQLTNSKGLAIGYNAAYSSRLTSSFRFGLTRQGNERTGLQSVSYAWPYAMGDSPLADTRGLTAIVPVQTLSKDMSWVKGAHTLQFGGVARVIRNRRLNLENSFHTAYPVAWSVAGGAAELREGIPDLQPNFSYAYTNTALSLLGALTTGQARYNYDIDGNVQPVGSPVARTFGMEEYELYLQDTWRVNRALTVTAGLRWSLMPPVREVNGVQTSLTQDFGEFFARRLALAEAGLPSRDAGRIGFVRRDSPEGRSLYPFHKKNFAPRFALAYTPQSTDGWAGKLFGAPGKTSLRAGFGMFHEVFGMGMMNHLDANSFGLSSVLQTATGTYTVASAPRFLGLTELPAELIPAPPPGGPGTPPDAFVWTDVVDQQVKPPYSLNLNLSIGRDLGRGFYVEGSYVGRLSRRGMIQDNGGAQQMNLRDPQSGMRVYEAAAALDRLARLGTPASQVRPIAFWENMYPGLAGDGLTATQAAYGAFVNNPFDAGTALVDLDSNCVPGCSRLGPYAIYQPQFWRLSAWRSLANANYHAMQWTVRKRFSEGYQFDLNYTWSKSIDLVSDPEAAREWTPGTVSSGFGALVNTLNPGQQRAVSDFDMTHQFNANWVAELPFGKGKRFGRSLPAAWNALVGGWQVSGLWRWTTGLPLAINNGAYWPTNWCCSHWVVPVGVPPVQTNSKNAPYIGAGSGPNVFSDPAAALGSFDFPTIGETGQRNGLRAHGIFTVDLGLGKRFLTPWEGQTVQFRAEAFNLTNSVRFNGRYMELGSPASFGVYQSALSTPRVLQFGLRYEF